MKCENLNEFKKSEQITKKQNTYLLKQIKIRRNELVSHFAFSNFDMNKMNKQEEMMNSL